jgi:hypothetical protein
MSYLSVSSDEDRCVAAQGSVLSVDVDHRISHDFVVGVCCLR